MLRLRSLRVRITLLATLAVTVALVAAALGLVFAVERTLIGGLENAAIERVDEVAGAIVAGRDPNTESDESPDVLVQVIDENGELIDTVPNGLIRFNIRETQPVTDPDQIPIAPGAPPPGVTVIRQLDTEELILAQQTVESPDGERTVVAISPFSEVSRSIDTIETALWIGIPFLIAFVAFVSWHLTGRTLKPVDAITRRADEISHSTLHERLPAPGTHDEVDRLAVTLNSMLSRLEESIRRQREFVSDASHELRSPIATIRAQLEVALTHPEGATWESVAEDSLGETARLERLVDDLLALAQAEELGSRRDPVELMELIEEEVKRGRDPRVTVHNSSAAVIHGDRDQLRRIVANLLDNARRHASERIDVTLGEEDGTVVLSVEDDGAGIPEDERERIFERFTRLEEARTRDSGGVGIGLALVARITASHHGSVRCLDSSLGGAKLEVKLPAVGPDSTFDSGQSA